MCGVWESWAGGGGGGGERERERGGGGAGRKEIDGSFPFHVIVADCDNALPVFTELMTWLPS